MTCQSFEILKLIHNLQEILQHKPGTLIHVYKRFGKCNKQGTLYGLSKAFHRVIHARLLILSTQKSICTENKYLKNNSMSHISWRGQKRCHIHFIFKQCFTESDIFYKITVLLPNAIETIFTFF